MDTAARAARQGLTLRPGLAWAAAALAVALAYPWVFASAFQQRLGALVLLYAITASAWNIVGGYAGQISVGHVVFFGCGAYGSLAAYTHWGWPPLAGLPLPPLFVTARL